ncbi:uncharacterized protein LOC109602103 [Aethina tumida]|uniref:uncharacterized protein LOC109602103 n=1 Tax=Aethina tumida TaxID=116153 RepID=UPI002148D927|nr:uncharacterized protein LOC109602103 [Aethina tumida]
MEGYTKKNRIGFGIGEKRFWHKGFHPQFLQYGFLYTPPNPISPATYDNEKPVCLRKRPDELWRKKYDCEVWSKNLGYHMPEVVHQREVDKTMRGPANIMLTNDARPDFLVKANRGFGYGMRFPESKKYKGPPPPDTYFRKMRQLSTVKLRSFSETPHMSWDTKPRFKEAGTKWVIGPARYRIKDNESIEARCNRSASKKRPLDFFTTERTYKSIKNHFGLGNVKPHEEFITPHSDLDYLLHHPSNDKKGAFLKSERWLKKPVVRELMDDIGLCYRNPQHPGPAHYVTEKYKCIKPHKEGKYPFSSSNVHVRPKINWEIRPGVGRYTIKWLTCKYKYRPGWQFISKDERGIKADATDYYAF